MKTEHVAIEMGSERSFGWVFAAVFLVVALWPERGALRGEGFDPQGVRVWALGVSAVFAGLGVFAPRLLRPLNRLWFRFGLLLGRVVAPVVMAVVYFGTVTPTGLVMRLLGKDLLRLKRDPDAESYWVVRHRPSSPGSMKNPF